MWMQKRVCAVRKHSIFVPHTMPANPLTTNIRTVGGSSSFSDTVINSKKGASKGRRHYIREV